MSSSIFLALSLGGIIISSADYTLSAKQTVDAQFSAFPYGHRLGAFATKSSGCVIILEQSLATVIAVLLGRIVGGNDRACRSETKNRRKSEQKSLFATAAPCGSGGLFIHFRRKDIGAKSRSKCHGRVRSSRPRFLPSAALDVGKSPDLITISRKEVSTVSLGNNNRLIIRSSIYIIARAPGHSTRCRARPIAIARRTHKLSTSASLPYP